MIYYTCNYFFISPILCVRHDLLGKLNVSLSFYQFEFCLFLCNKLHFLYNFGLFKFVHA